MENKHQVACERCGAQAGLASTIAPLGDNKGAYIYGCSACRHFTWVDWHGGSGAQQQRQPGPNEH